MRAGIRDFDRAAIFTIHGFCARMLGEQAFESSLPFDTELSGSGDEIRREVVEDWFRRRVYPLSPFHRALLDTARWGLEPMHGVAEELFRKPDALCVPASPGVSGEQVQQALGELLAEFATERDAIGTFFREAIVDAFFKKGFHGDFEPSWSVLEEAFRTGSAGDPELPRSLAHFEPSNVEGNLTKRKASRYHPPEPIVRFCRACARVNALGRDWVLGLKTEFAHSIRAAYAARKTEERVQTFDDLLLNLRGALRDPLRGTALVASIRQAFGAALIDEFQDTDPVQYEIFRRLFVEGGLPVFLVGDPKQAIYGFRSGDVYTYFAARNEADQAYSLDTNYRSEGRLIEAVNALFRGCEGRSAFVTRQIAYERIEAQGKAPTASLLVGGKPYPDPFKIWFYRNENGKAVAKTGVEFQDVVHETVAAEIARVVSDRRLTLAGKRVAPSDIAVLVMAHEQASRLKRRLARRGIPAVLQATGSIFDTPEAADLLSLARAMASARDGATVRSALATPFLGWRGTELFALLDEEGGTRIHRLYEQVFELLRKTGELWQQAGFIRAFNELAGATGMRRRLLGLDNGERRLTNLLQLVEILHATAQERKLGPTGVVNWLQRQLVPDLRERAEEHEMRLESDRDAVTVMTVFRSKGLQFPIVFVPWMWHRQATNVGRQGILSYHRDARPGSPLVLDLAPDDSSAGAARAADEGLAEQVRLLYVALTRAVHRTYLFWGDISSTASTGLSYVLHGIRRAGDVESPGLAHRLRDLSGDDKEADIDRLCENPGFRRIPLLDPASVPALTDAARAAAEGRSLACREWPAQRKIERGWGVTSFTGLAPAHAEAPETVEGYDFDEADTGPPPDPEDSPGGIFDFPAGPRTGNCWHAIFEALEFGGDDEHIRAVVCETMDRFHLVAGDDEARRREQCEPVVEMVRTVLDAPLDGAGLRLRDLAPRDVLREVEFTFPLGADGIHTRRLAELLRSAAGWPLREEFSPYLDAWRRELSGGFMTGFIDLVFRTPAGSPSGHPRYCILDWKSNKLGGNRGSFDRAGLVEAMGRNAYVLQYLVYTVALDRYLRVRIADYDYERDFGGIYYVFLRGVDPAGRRGVFRDRPPARLIRALAREMGAFQP